jgi:hypothetical protein
MSEKADITFRRKKGGGLVAVPDPFVLQKQVTRIRIHNDSDTDIRLDLKDAPVKEDELRIGAGAVASVTVKRSVPAGQYDYGAGAAPPARRGRLEGSPKIVLEASPKIVVEASPKVLVEGSPKIIVQRSSKGGAHA